MDSKHILTDVWDKFPEIRAKDPVPVKTPSLERLLAEMFSVGEFYYYTLDIAESAILNCHSNVLKMHGLKDYPRHLSELLELTHPEDIPFVIEAEKMTIEKIKEIGFEHYSNLKTSYCFRMKTADGSYQLFHHQALNMIIDSMGKARQVINIHTNINHITPVNNYIVLVCGVNGRSDFHQLQYKPKETKNLPVSLTKREKEILHLLAQGYTSTEIADLLIVSHHTVLTHRKNILKKTDVRNSAELIKKCVELGYV